MKKSAQEARQEVEENIEIFKNVVFEEIKLKKICNVINKKLKRE